MKVKLISYSKASEFETYEDGGLLNVQDLIAFCARVSNPANQMNKETSAKLIKYLIKHQHWSPLEMVSACLEIETTRDIAHQIVRHRSFSFQEFSQRYANPTEALAFKKREARLQDPKRNTINLNGKDITEYAFQDYRNFIGYVPQEPMLFNGTFRENINIYKKVL